MVQRAPPSSENTSSQSSTSPTQTFNNNGIFSGFSNSGGNFNPDVQRMVQSIIGGLSQNTNINTSTNVF